MLTAPSGASTSLSVLTRPLNAIVMMVAAGIRGVSLDLTRLDHTAGWEAGLSTGPAQSERGDSCAYWRLMAAWPEDLGFWVGVPAVTSLRQNRV